MHRRTINIECRSRFAFRGVPSDLIRYRQLPPLNTDTGSPLPPAPFSFSAFCRFRDGPLSPSTLKAQSDKQAADRERLDRASSGEAGADLR